MLFIDTAKAAWSKNPCCLEIHGFHWIGFSLCFFSTDSGGDEGTQVVH